MEMWLNDTTVDGFLGNLREPEKFIKMDSKWNASQMSDASKPPSNEEGGIIVESLVGLLNVYEYNMTGYGNGYLNNHLVWWMLTPNATTALKYIDIYGVVQSTSFRTENGVRPSINLKPEIKIVSGDGSEENPYRLEGDNDANLSGTLLSNRYSGEYISFGTGENNLYRIVSHETEGLTKITSAEPLKENGVFKNIAFGDNVYYSSTNTIGSFLNEEYLANYVGSENSGMIEDHTTWYLGTVGSGQNYRLGKYTDINMGSLTSNITQNQVGLLRLGELMAGQFDSYKNNTNYWTLTPHNTSLVRCVDSIGNAFNLNYLDTSKLRPSLNLKSNVIITGGTGLKNDPFTIELAN